MNSTFLLTAFYFKITNLSIVRIVLEVHGAGQDQSQPEIKII